MQCAEEADAQGQKGELVAARGLGAGREVSGVMDQVVVGGLPG